VNNQPGYQGNCQGRWTYLEGILERFNMWKAVNNIGDSWAETKESMMNCCWKQLCPELITNFEGFEETPEAATTYESTGLGSFPLCSFPS
jgi:hypothetical protein